MPQAPLVQARVPFATAGHTFPQEPQLSGSVRSVDSQPLAMDSSQSVKPEKHAAISQDAYVVPFHVCVPSPFTTPHAITSAAHVLLALTWNPCAQLVTVQMPYAVPCQLSSPVPFAIGHDLTVATQRPSAVRLYPGLHALAPHTPARHARVPFATAGHD
jgi:hypothetical protein